MNKGREFWVSPDRDAKTSVVYEDSNGMAELVDCFCASEEPLDCDAIHVIEYQAYKTALDALKKFSLGESQWMDGVECMHEARAVLKELGEHE